MKPFNLEAAKRGEKLVTRCGDSVDEFHHFETTNGNAYSCIAIVGGVLRSHAKDGAYIGGCERPEDLFMAPKKRTVYVQIFDKPIDGESDAYKAVAYKDKGDAEDNLRETTWKVLAVAVPVEIEE
jgi:hypothetical protein